MDDIGSQAEGQRDNHFVKKKNQFSLIGAHDIHVSLICQ